MNKTKSPLLKIRSLTNYFGIYQHGKLSEIDRDFGFALEDQARALIVANDFKDYKLKKIYRNFIVNSYKEGGHFCQFYYEDENGNINIPEKCECSEEAKGITLWALLKSYKRRNKEVNKIVKDLSIESGKWIHIRSISSAILGLTCLKKQSETEKKLVKKIYNFYENNSDNDWQWFESKLTYANAIIPWSLWRVAKTRNDKQALKIAKESTEFLVNKCQKNGVPLVIGCNGWHCKTDTDINEYDQQPIDAAYMVCCLEAAYETTKNKYYLDWLSKWGKWFFGNNTKQICMIDDKGGCFDGITNCGFNENQGAESNICYLMTLAAIKRQEKNVTF